MPDLPMPGFDLDTYSDLNSNFTLSPPFKRKSLKCENTASTTAKVRSILYRLREAARLFRVHRSLIRYYYSGNMCGKDLDRQLLCQF